MLGELTRPPDLAQSIMNAEAALEEPAPVLFERLDWQRVAKRIQTMDIADQGLPPRRSLPGGVFKMSRMVRYAAFLATTYNVAGRHFDASNCYMGLVFS